LEVQENKIIPSQPFHHKTMQIKPVNLIDLVQVADLQPEGWDNIATFYEFYVQQDFCFPIGVWDENRLIGVGCAIQNGDTGWLSHIIVHEDYRGKGIGKTITETVVNMLKNQHIHDIQLIATDLGEPVYQKLGFEICGEYLFLKGSNIPPENHDFIQKIDATYWEQVLAIDQAISGEYREKMLQTVYQNAFGFVKNGELQGYYLPEMCEGLIYALNEEAGIRLLNFKLNQKQEVIQKVALPIQNTVAIDYLEKQGFEVFRRLSRMCLGRKIAWQPHKIYSRAGGYYG
jgi:GNAT superfamily N-acetyltransferase